MEKIDPCLARNTFANVRLVIFNNSYEPMPRSDETELRNTLLVCKSIKTLVIKNYMTKQIWDAVFPSNIFELLVEFDVEHVTLVGCDGDMLRMNIGSALRRSTQLRNLNIGALRGYEPSTVSRMFTMDSIADTVATMRGLHCLKLSVTNDGVWRNRRRRKGRRQQQIKRRIIPVKMSRHQHRRRVRWCWLLSTPQRSETLSERRSKCGFHFSLPREGWGE